MPWNGVLGGFIGENRAVPDFQSLMLPMLMLAADGREHRVAFFREQISRELARHFYF